MSDSFKSKTQKKEEAKMVEEIAGELVELPPSLLSQLPCEEEILAEIHKAQDMKKFGAQRRQLKYLSKLLRESELDPVLKFLEEAQNSHLKRNKISHTLEKLRDRILHEEEEEQALQEAKEELPALNIELIRDLAQKFRWTRSQKFSREIFRQLKIAQNHSK